jgi:hypothetical protein
MLPKTHVLNIQKRSIFPLINIFPVEQMRESQTKHSWAISPRWERHFQALCAFLITKDKTHICFKTSIPIPDSVLLENDPQT